MYFLIWIETAVGVISPDALLPLCALAVGTAFGIIQIYAMSRDKAYDLAYKAVTRRLDECEHCRDTERHERDEFRDALSDAHAQIAELRARYERGGRNAGA